jgi:sulfate adenylyltransferase subunit 1
MDLLRFITAGSVDDGKSTLIGRLLYDSKSILADQLEAIERQSRNKANGDIDLALLTDGLRAEREQGITIDIAYRYFTTAKRKFIIADAPGHIQYTRNMITGASNSELIIILVDARHGVVEQTRRHSIIASLLRIPKVIVAINKMDLVGFAADAYNNIAADYAGVAGALGINDVTYIPISALRGDNIVTRSAAMDWYTGDTLLDLLENVTIADSGQRELPARFPVQYVIRPQTDELHDYRGYAGKILSGTYKVSDPVTILPSGIQTRITGIELDGKPLLEAVAFQSVILHLEDDADISRGDTIVKRDELPQTGQELGALICWMDHKPLQPGTRYILQHNSRTTPVIIKELEYLVDVNTLQRNEYPVQVTLNEIVKASVKTAIPLAFDAYDKNRANGAAILIDETTNATVGALLLQ